MNAEQHAQAILNAIQAAESAGFMVTLSEYSDAIFVADHYCLNEPRMENGVWEMSA